MQIAALSKSVRMSPRKVRLVADQIKHLPAVKAIETLRLTPKRGATPLAKAIKSAMANATHNNKLDSATLMIDHIDITEGQVLKRFRPSTRGRTHPYKKRGTHIRVVLTDDRNQKSNIKNQKIQ